MPDPITLLLSTLVVTVRTLVKIQQGGKPSSEDDADCYGVVFNVVDNLSAGVLGNCLHEIRNGSSSEKEIWQNHDLLRVQRLALRDCIASVPPPDGANWRERFRWRRQAKKLAKTATEIWPSFDNSNQHAASLRAKDPEVLLGDFLRDREASRAAVVEAWTDFLCICGAFVEAEPALRQAAAESIWQNLPRHLFNRTARDPIAAHKATLLKLEDIRRLGEATKKLGEENKELGEENKELGEENKELAQAANEKLDEQKKTLVNLEQALSAPRPLVSLHQLPPPVAEFTGRDADLDDLEAALLSHKAAGATISARHAGLQGMGGVGKTALATMLAHRLEKHYPDAQLVLNLRGADPERRAPMTPQQAMQEIIHLFHPTAQLSDDLEALQRDYHAVLNQAGRVLLLLDNAAGAEQVRPLVPPADCLLLVTSRTQFSLPGLVARNLDCLEPHESEALLGRLAPRLNEHAHEAAALLGHLPLALEVFAGAANGSRLLPPAQLVERLRQKQERLDKVNAAFQVSAELLDADLRRRWMQLAVFPASFTLQAAAALWESDEEATRLALEELLNASLLEYNENVGRFRLHDLIRQFCDAQLSAAEKYDSQKRHAAYYLWVLASADDLFLKGHEAVLQGMTLLDDERAHIEAGQSWAATHAVQDDEAARLCMNYPDAGAYVLNLRQPPRQRIEWLDDALKATRQLKERMSEGNRLGNLGIAYHSLGEVRRAIEYHEQHLEIAREIGDRHGEGAALGSLGIAYYSLGEMQRAIEYHEQHLEIAREIGDRRGEGAALGSLGNAYYSLGEMQRAIEYYEQILIIHREIGDRHAEGQDLGNLGVAYYSLGEMQRAIEYYEQYLEIAREIGDRSGEGTALWNMSLALDELGERARAIPLAEAALVIREAIEDPRAPKVRAKLEEWRAEAGGEAAGN